MAQFIELTQANDEKLYLPTSAILTYEDVPKGKNESYNERGTFIRFNVGTGLKHCICQESFDFLMEQVGNMDFVIANNIDGSKVNIRMNVVQSIISIKADEDEEPYIELGVKIGNAVVPIVLSNTYEQIKGQLR